MTRFETRAPWPPLLLAAVLLLLPGALGAQPEAIPIAELTTEQFGGLPDDQVIALDEGETTLGELRAREEARRAAHPAAVAESQKRAQAALASHEAARAESEAIEAAAQDRMVTGFLAFVAELAAANPEIVHRARKNAEFRRKASELRRQAYKATSEAELQRIERELRRLRRDDSPGG